MSFVRDVVGAKGAGVLMVEPDATVARVAQRMRSSNVGAFVVSRDGRRVEGIITERDIVHGLARHGETTGDARAADVMSHHVETCTPDDTVRSVMATMTETRSRHVLVLDGGIPWGVVSIGDLIKHYVDETDLETRVLRDVYLAHRGT